MRAMPNRNVRSENYRSGQPISEYIQNNLAPHFSPDLINPQHFCHSARRKPVRLSKSGLGKFFANSFFENLSPHLQANRCAAPRSEEKPVAAMKLLPSSAAGTQSRQAARPSRP